MCAANVRPGVCVGRAVRRLLLVLALVTVPALMPAPAGACSCAAVEPGALLEQVRAGAVVVDGVQVGAITEGAITVAVREAVGEDVGPRLRVPVLAPVERVDPVSGGVITASSSCDALQVEPPAAAAGPVRFLGPAPDPYGGQAGSNAAGEYAGILGEDIPQGRVVRCPGDAVAWVLEGAQLFDGHNGEAWWRVDTASLTGRPLVRRAQVNGDPFANPNILTEVHCLDPEGRDLVALFTW